MTIDFKWHSAATKWLSETSLFHFLPAFWSMSFFVAEDVILFARENIDARRSRKRRGLLKQKQYRVV